MATVPATSFDIIIIGGGPGGYVAAIRAAQLGLNAALIEREHLGGICLNWGCIPTKALLRSADINHLLTTLPDYGFSADNIKFDLAAVVQRSRTIAKQLSAGVQHLLRKNKVTVFDGTAKLAGANTVTVEKSGATKALTAPHIILATGARARAIPGLEPNGKHIWSYKEAMVPTTVPKHLLVVGSGAIGCEFASFYQTMGAQVTIVEMQDRILPLEDTEISTFARAAFEKQGMRIITAAQLSAIKTTDTAVTLTLTLTTAAKAETLTFDHVISAIGIIGNTENLGLESTKIIVEKTHIKIDGFGRTAHPGIYAIGDIAGPPWLAHKASHEAVICVEAIAGLNPHPLNTANIPGCTYCRPQIASVGLTESAARAAGYDLKIGKFPFIGNGKAIALGEPEGFTKTIFDAKTGALLGAHMIGAEVTEMIQGFVIARTLETTEAELMHTIFPHPTISETMHESVLAAYGRAIHI